jgi:hypothetical protein
LRQVFLEDNAKMTESECEFNVREGKILRLDESYLLVTTVLVQNSHSRNIQNIFLTTIAAAARFQPRWTSLDYISFLKYISMIHIKNIFWREHVFLIYVTVDMRIQLSLECVKIIKREKTKQRKKQSEEFYQKNEKFIEQ